LDEREIPMASEASSGGLNSLLSAIVDSSDDAIVSKSLDGIITSWNAAAETMFGYTAAEVIGQSIRIIIPADRQDEEDYVIGQIRQGHRVKHFETIRRAKDGRELNVSLTISPVRDASGHIIGASKIARNITDKVRLERERERLLASERQARDQLVEALRARDEFIAVAAHELRNPLNVFQLSLHILHSLAYDKSALDRMPRFIEKCQNQLRQLSSLVDRLFDVSRIRSGTFELDRESSDLAVQVGEIVARFRSMNPSTQISLEAPPELKCRYDRVRIDQALTNLLSNAVKFGRKKPIEVVVSTTGQKIEIRVADHGIGIAREDLERIFDRFERASKSASTVGLGLGLWIAKSIAVAHGGDIQVESEPDHGSTFIMSLPLHIQ
jgi:PAS domain S-box-containing protein